MSTSKEWRERMMSAYKAGANDYRAKWTKLVAEAMKESDQIAAERTADSVALAEGRPLPVTDTWRIDRRVPSEWVPVHYATLLGIEWRLAELEWRLAELEECGAVEFAWRKKAASAFDALDECLARRHLKVVP